MSAMIKTPDQRLRVFVSSTLQELAEERESIKKAILNLHLIPVMFEMGARPFPPRDLYTAYLQQSHIFIGVYWEKYGWVAPGMAVSGIEDEFMLSSAMPRLVYIKEPSGNRVEELKKMIGRIENSNVSYKVFNNSSELQALVQNDLALLLTERFELSAGKGHHSSLNTDELNQQIPMPVTHLIGREREVKEICDLIAQKEVALITLTGIGGIGKTRVALEVARQIKNKGALQVCFVPLDSVEQAENVPEAILRKAFPEAKSSESSVSLMVQLFTEKHVLLVLDNFEQVIQAFSVVVELLQQCPRLTILVTSRELLRVSGEVEYSLNPLELCQPEIESAMPAFEELSPAVQLFVSRARAFRPDFKLTKENYATVAKICQALDGIPLAIELATARMRLFTPAQLLPRLEQRFDLLKTTTQDIPARHQTLRATIDWSFNLLTPAEQRLLCLLSVFSGGCSLEAVGVIASDHTVFDKVWDFPRISMYLTEEVSADLASEKNEAGHLDMVESLLAKSLAYTSVNKYGTLRINFYQTIIQYCRGRLPDFDLQKEAYRRHLIYFLFVAESNWAALRGDNASEIYELFDNDIDNMMAALDWSIDHEPLFGLRLAVALEEYWDTRAKSNEAVKWIELLLETIKKDGADHSKITDIANLGLMRAYFRIARYDDSWELAKQGVDEARKENDHYKLIDSLGFQTLLNIYAFRNENKEAIYNEAIALARKHNYKMRLLDLMMDAATDKTFSGFIEEGIRTSEEALQLAIQLKAKRWQAITYTLLGFSNISIGNTEKAEFCFHECLKCAADVNDQMLPIYGMLGCAQVALLKQQVSRALTLVGAVQAVIKRPGITLVPIVTQTLNGIMEQVNIIPAEKREAGLSEGRKLHLDEAVRFALDEKFTLEKMGV